MGARPHGGDRLAPPGPWTVGFLTRHIWSVGGNGREADVNETYLQPFVSYTTQDAWTVGLNTKFFLLLDRQQASVPINLAITKLVRLGGAAISFGPGVRYWVEDPDDAAHGWGFRSRPRSSFPTIRRATLTLAVRRVEGVTTVAGRI